jgi:VIT1/CCC1 family predicted Fe2+/Mn2+ transporter
MDRHDLQARATEAQSGGVRAAVLGINDGLSTNIALILGVAGANPDPAIVRIAGVASLVAGACSMAMGEYISMKTQVELLERILNELRATLRSDAAQASSSIEGALVKNGIDPAIAKSAADELSKNPDRALSVYASAVLGIGTSELGSPWLAAIASFVTFAVGAAVPLLPWFFLASADAWLWSIALGIVAAFIVGAFLGNRTDGRWLRGGARQVAFISFAAAITYGVGRLFRVVVG